MLQFTFANPRKGASSKKAWYGPVLVRPFKERIGRQSRTKNYVVHHLFWKIKKAFLQTNTLPLRKENYSRYIATNLFDPIISTYTSQHLIFYLITKLIGRHMKNMSTCCPSVKECMIGVYIGNGADRGISRGPGPPKIGDLLLNFLWTVQFFFSSLTGPPEHANSLNPASVTIYRSTCSTCYILKAPNKHACWVMRI